MMIKKIIFMGTPSYGSVILKHLIDNKFNIQAIVTSEDKKTGRGQKITPPHIKQFCIDNKYSFDILQPKNVKEPSFLQKLKSYKIDFIVVGAYGQILSQDILDIAPCINLHSSLLPKYRGASPIHSSILNNDKFSGVSAMAMSLKMDVGDILGYSFLNIKHSISYTNILEIYYELSVLAGKLAVEVINKYDTLEPKVQNNTQTNYCIKIKKNDGLIKFDNAKQIYLKHKAFYLWPQIFTDEQIKLKKIELENSHIKYKKSKKILKIEKKLNYVVISCLVGALKIFSIQEPSKQAININDFINKKGLKVGDYIF
jgi:methionyl-tRNA formyltransferase